MLELESDDRESSYYDNRGVSTVCARAGRFFTRHSLNLISLFRGEQLERLIFEDSPPTPVIRQPNAMKTGQRWLLVFVLCLSLVVLIVLMNSVSVRHGSLTITLDLDELTERDKCPACFGVHLCPQMVSGKIELNDWTKYSVSKLVNSKNIFYATWNSRGGSKKLILKKLAHDDELGRLDKEICERHGRSEDMCDVKSSVKFLIDKYAHTTASRPDEPMLHGEKIGKVTDILLCPSQNKMDYMINAVTKISRGPHRTTILAHILTMLLLNPEPLILQTFRAEDGWPFPMYYGACGRIVAEEYVGRRLTTFYNDDFRTRALISYQLLKIAFQLSEASNFTLYLADISADNFAVNEDDYTVKVIDLENIIVVDKQHFKHGESMKVHEASSMRCENRNGGNSEGECFSFSPDDLCNHPVTDHNFYAVCSGLLVNDPLSPGLPKGLLHSIPDEITNSPKYEKFAEYLESCHVPGPKANRIEAARGLMNLLAEYLGLPRK